MKKNVKLNISLEPEFYELLEEKAKEDYLKVATLTKQILKRSLLSKNNNDSNCITKNEEGME
jgi:predicted DNA-binding ribbon-helix-helix protein